MTPNTDEIKARLKGAGLRATTGRIAVLGLLMRDHSHPLIEDVYRRVKRRLPGMSLSTVYDTVERLVDTGLCRRVETPGEPTRLDAQPAGHLHARCVVCGRIVDLPEERFVPPEVPARPVGGFKLQSVRVMYEGLCSSCRHN